MNPNLQLSGTQRQFAFGRGQALLAGKSVKEAIEALQTALGEHGESPGTAEILEKLATAYKHANQPEAVFRTYVQLAEIQPEAAATWLSLAGSGLDHVAAQAATSWLTERYGSEGSAAKALYPRLAPQIVILFSRLSAALKRKQHAVDLLRVAGLGLEEDRKSAAEELYKIGTGSAGVEDASIAELALRSAIEIDPSHLNSRLGAQQSTTRRQLRKRVPEPDSGKNQRGPFGVGSA